MFDRKHTCVVVVGAQWGDEGKGKLVDVLSEQADLVVRYQGGANAGHTVVIGDRQFILHQIPSGILHPAATCVVGNGVVLDPETFFAELDGLGEQGIDIAGRLFVSERAHLVLPYHKLLDAGRASGSNRSGPPGAGSARPTRTRSAAAGIRVADSAGSGARASRLLAERIDRANQLLELMGASERASSTSTWPCCAAGRRHAAAPGHRHRAWCTRRAPRAGRRVLLEGAQGALLDVDHGTYPFVTSSNTTAGGAVGRRRDRPDRDRRRARGGEGLHHPGRQRPAADRQPPGVLEEQLRELGDEFGAITGRPRRCGWFDAEVVRYSVRVNGLTGLAVTKLDVLDAFDEIPVGVGYKLDGERCDGMPSEVEALERVEPVYEMLPGWQASTAGAGRWPTCRPRRGPISTGCRTWPRRRSAT